MAVEVHLIDDQHQHAVDGARWASLAAAAVAAMGVSGEAELSLCFVDEQTIAELNTEYLGHEGATDVLSFPIEEAPFGQGAPGGPPLLLGDVVICPAVAAANAPEHQTSEDEELALLVVHGVLHLFGLDHEDDGEAEEMERLERELLGAHFEGGR